MKLIYNNIFLEHDTGMHPESKKRLEVLKLKETDVLNGEKYLGLVHSKAYIEFVKKACKKSENLDPDTATSEKSYEAAVYAVGATIQASETNDFAIVRPPGHHSYPDRSSGFCIFNNISIAVQKLVNEGKRVMIFDFDGHFGNGTSRIFYNTDKVLYFSLHQYPAFPGSGWVDEIGAGKGKGFNINIPLPPGSGDDIYFKALDRFFIADQFSPDIIAISAGFDAHKDDPLLNLRLSTGVYYKIGKFLKKFNAKKMFATLEGGYNTNVLPKCIQNFIDGVNNELIKHKDQPTDSMIQVTEEYKARAYELEKNLLPYWKILSD